MVSIEPRAYSAFHNYRGEKMANKCWLFLDSHDFVRPRHLDLPAHVTTSAWPSPAALLTG